MLCRRRRRVAADGALCAQGESCELLRRAARAPNRARPVRSRTLCAKRGTLGDIALCGTVPGTHDGQMTWDAFYVRPV